MMYIKPFVGGRGSKWIIKFRVRFDRVCVLYAGKSGTFRRFV